MVRYGWKPKHSGTEAEVVGVTVVSMVSSRLATVMSRVTTCGNGKLVSNRGWPPKSRSAVSRLSASCLTSQPG